MQSFHSRRRPGQMVAKAIIYTIVGLFGFATFYPFWYILIASFNSGADFTRGGVYLWPRVFTLANYREAFLSRMIVNALTISVGRTVLGVLLGISFTALFAYAMHIRTLPGRTWLVIYFFITTIVGGGMIPYYFLLRALNLTKSFWIYVIPSIFNFFNMVLMRTFFDGIPSELRESAVVDGANEWRVIARIYLPLSIPVMATVSLFIGVAHWNDWFTGAYYVSNQKLYPAATYLQKILTEAQAAQTIQVGRETAAMFDAINQTTPQSLQMAFVMLLTMPIVAVYPFLQKYYVKGVMVGAIKG
ncbi:MAG: carbohydrate ABC transporter permease [Oscillospiraceae bacterium]|jgi:putative aldouronate transport system permease protein|nr:carbohydrate ABC transporter permease [Oscillospiraceae bacterium]